MKISVKIPNIFQRMRRWWAAEEIKESESAINLLCDGDYEHREALRAGFTLEDMFDIEKKKAAQKSG